MIQVSSQIAVTLALAFLGLVFGFGRILLAQFERRMAERFRAQDEQRALEIQGVRRDIADNAAEIRSMKEHQSALATMLPLEYVRREDWIRFSAAIDHKLDRLAELLMQQAGGNRARD